MREKLIDLKIKFVESFDCGNCKPEIDKCKKCLTEKEADYLLANGVIVPPCPIGTKIYMLVTKRPKLNFPEFTFIKDSKLTFHNIERVIEDFGKEVFLTKEEAEQALKERENND